MKSSQQYFSILILAGLFSLNNAYAEPAVVVLPTADAKVVTTSPKVEVTPEVKVKPCTIAKVVVFSNHQGSVQMGNGIALDDQHLIINDHTLGAKPSSVEVFVDGRTYKARVVGQDYHTDVAVLRLQKPEKMEEPILGACDIRPSYELESQQTMSITGYKADDAYPYVLRTSITNPRSFSSSIPGLDFSIELQAPVQKGMSGSAVMLQSRVYGMLAQSTEISTSLAIPGEILNYVSHQLLKKGKIPRHYTVDEDQSHIVFQGLAFAVDSGSSGVGQGAWNHVHENRRGFVSKQSNTTAYLVAEAVDMKAVRQFNPLMAQELELSRTRTVYIHAIGPKKIYSVVELMKVAESCANCTITEFVVPGVNTMNLEADPYTLLFSLVNTLITDISAGSQSALGSNLGVLTALQDYAKLLVKYQGDFKEFKNLSVVSKKEISEQWEIISQMLSSQHLSDADWAIIGKILEAQTKLGIN